MKNLVKHFSKLTKKNRKSILKIRKLEMFINSTKRAKIF